MAKRRGRKRKQGVDRHPSGQVVRTGPAATQAAERNVKQIVKEARLRQFGPESKYRAMVPPSLADSQFSGTAIGRLVQCDMLKYWHWVAAQQYREAVYEAREAALAKMPRSASDYSGKGGWDSSDGTKPEYVETCQRALTRMREIDRVIVATDPLLGKAAIDLWAVADVEAWGMEGAMRVVLDALVHHFRIPKVDDLKNQQNAA